MTTRSTRNKIRFQAEKAYADIDRALGHLKYLDELQEGRSGYIERYLPRLVELIMELMVVMTQFRDGL